MPLRTRSKKALPCARPLSGGWHPSVCLFVATSFLMAGMLLLLLWPPTSASASLPVADAPGKPFQHALALQPEAEETPVRELPLPTIELQLPPTSPPASDPPPTAEEVEPQPTVTYIAISTVGEAPPPTELPTSVPTDIPAADTPIPGINPAPSATALSVDTPVPTPDTGVGVETETAVGTPDAPVQTTSTPIVFDTATAVPTATLSADDFSTNAAATIVAAFATTTITSSTSVTSTITIIVPFTPGATQTVPMFDASCYIKPAKETPVVKLAVPYVHQVNDVAGADGNWACGPTTIVMALAYYGKLEPWQTYQASLRESEEGDVKLGSGRTRTPTAKVVTPTATPSTTPTLRAGRTPRVPATQTPGTFAQGADFSPYVTNSYSMYGRTYSATARDPDGKQVAGLYGTICPTGYADWSTMATVLQWHGLSTKQIGVSYNSVVAALKRGHPVMLGTRLTSEGHILLAIGYTANGYLIFNDPYGDRFSPGYGRNNGKEVLYKWDCLTAHTAVEVIGTLPTPSPTPPEPTQTAWASPSVTSTSTPMPTVPVKELRSSPPLRLTPDSSNSLYHGRS